MKSCSFSFLLVVVLICVAPCLQAQNNFDDSLKRELAKPHLSDSTRTALWIKLGDECQYNNTSYARQCYENAYQLAKKNHDVYLTGNSVAGFGRVYYSLGKYDSARYYFSLADSLFQTVPIDEAQESSATIKADLANVEVSQNKYESAVKKYLEAIKIMEKSKANNKWVVLGNLYASVAIIYNNLNQFDKALVYDLKGLAAHKKAKNNVVLTTYLQLYVGDDYINLKQFEKAKAHLKSGEELAKIANSNDLFQKLYEAWGRLYQKSGRADSAVVFYQKALPYARLTGRTFLLMNNLRMLGFAHRDLKNYVVSERFLRQALTLAKELKNQRQESELLKNLGLVSAAQKKEGQAVTFYQQYIQLNDSLNEADVQKRINEIENKYQVSKMQDSIALLHKDFQLQQADLHKKQTQNAGLIGGCSLLLMLSGVVYKNVKNKNQLLKQNEELQIRRIGALEKEKQLVVMQSILKGQEEERSRLARDLHDGVGGLLSGVKFSLATMKGNVFISEANAAAFNRAIMQLDQSIAELRQVSHNMMPESLIKFGLAETLENYCATLNHSKILNVQLQTYGLENRLEQSTEIILYRIIQELLTNSIRHGQAQNILVQLIQENGHFSLTVEDDGKGFLVQEAERKGGAGLGNVRTRVAYLDGTLDIQSRPGDGTSIYIEGNCR